MSADIPPILIDVQVEMGRVKAQLDTLQNEIKQIGTVSKAQESKVGGLEGKLGKMAGNFKKMLGLAAVTTVLTASAKAAVEDAESMALLNKQLEISVGANQAQMAAVDANIQKMTEVTGIVDDDIRPGFANLIRVTEDVATAQSYMTLALDASVAKGKDVTQVAQALAQAHTGNTKRLSMLFPELKNSSDMMGDLAKNTKGAAEAAADANPMKRLTAQFDILKETLGEVLIPVLQMFTRILKPLMPLFELIASVLDYVVQAVMPLVETLLNALMPAFMAIGEALKPILEKLLPPLIKLMEKVFVPVLIFLSDIIIMYLIPYLEKLATVMGDFLSGAVDFLVKGFEQLIDLLGPFWKNVLKPLIDGMMNLMGIKVEPVVKPKVDDSALAKLDYSGIAGLGKVQGKGAEAKAKKDPAIAMAKQVATDTLKAQKDYQSAVLKAQADYQKTVIDRMKEFTQKFEDAVKVDVSALFNEGYQSAEMLIEGMKAKLASAKTFADDIAKLSAMNYSEEFLNQIMSLGPVMGNQMATMLLSGAPEVQEEIKSLFSESQLISKTGVDGVAKSLIPTFTDATTRLGNAMVDAANSLSTALNKIKNITPEQIVGATKGAKVLATTPTNAGGKGGLVVNTNVVNAGAGANEIASSVVNAIKFNQPFVDTYVNNLATNAVNNIMAEWNNPFGRGF